MSVQAVDEGLDRRLVEMSQVRSTLSGFLAEHERLWVNQTESINDNLALDGLNRIDNHCNSPRGQLFEGLLGIDIDG